MYHLLPNLSAVKRAVRAILRYRNPTYAHLILATARQPRYTPGTFAFPFGRMHYVDGLSLCGNYFELFIQREYDFICSHQSPLVLDCGANIGLSMVAFRQRYPQSRIVGFEADPAIATTLRTNVENLNLLHGVEVIQMAVWNQQGTVSFVADGADAGRIGEEQPAAQQISAVRLSDYITETIDLLKLDIEGAEYVVLQDLCDTGKVDKIQRIICEFHGWSPVAKKTGSLLEALSQVGMVCTFTYARSAPDLPGTLEPTPFPSVRDGKYLLRMYAWRPKEQSNL